MNTLKRLSSSIKANIDWMIGQIENHEGLIEATIREVHQTAARAKVQLNKVRADGQAIRRKLIELRESEELWLERAKKVAKGEEEKALACLKRKNALAAQIKSLEEQHVEHSRTEKLLTEDLTRIEEKLLKLKNQKNLMRSRQSRAEALNLLNHEDSQVFSEIDSIFERWETKVTEYEMQSGCYAQCGPDSLEQDFLSNEEETELRAQLQEILNNN